MKQAVLVFCILAALGACASFPQPEGEGNSLVIGYLALDFPDGYFNRPARTIRSGIRLHLRNESRQTDFSLMTSSGYYYFLSNGTDSYSLESYEYEDTAERAKLGRSKIDLKFEITPGKVVYLGHLTISYKIPKLTLDSLEKKTYRFEVDSSVRWEKEETLLYIVGRDPDSRWLEYEVVEPGAAE